MHPYSVMRLAGIRIVVDPSWIFIFLLVVISLATGYLPAAAPDLSTFGAWILAMIAALMLFGSVLVHELSHAVLARRAGIQVPRIRMFLFGGISEMAAEPHQPSAELRIAAAGPLVSLVLAAGFSAVQRLFLGPEPTTARALLHYLATANLALGIFNLLPGLPLDGGRILRAWLWSRHGNLMRATRSAGRVGVALGIALIGVGLLSLTVKGYLSGLWLILIGVYLQHAASASYETMLLRDLLSGVRVRQVMTREVHTVPDHISLEELVHEHFLRQGHGTFPVLSSEVLAGMVSIEQVRRVPRDEWVRTPVRQVMTPIANCPPISPEDECLTVLERMLRDNVSPLPVALDGRVVGVLSRRDVLQLYRVRSTLTSR